MGKPIVHLAVHTSAHTMLFKPVESCVEISRCCYSTGVKASPIFVGVLFA